MGELDETMSWRELQRWALFIDDEPLLPERVDLAGGLVAFMLASINRSKTGPRPELDDFMLVAHALRERQRQGAEDSLTDAERDDRQMRAFVLALGGTLDG